MSVNYPGLWVAAAVLLITAAAAFLTRQWHNPGIFFGLLVVMALVGAVLYSLANPVPESEVGGLLIGTLISAFTLVMGWLFGPNRRPPEALMSIPRSHDDKPKPEPAPAPALEPTEAELASLPPAHPTDIQSEDSPSIPEAPEDEEHGDRA
jgi:hypothetical protein